LSYSNINMNTWRLQNNKPQVLLSSVHIYEDVRLDSCKGRRIFLKKPSFKIGNKPLKLRIWKLNHEHKSVMSLRNVVSQSQALRCSAMRAKDLNPQNKSHSNSCYEDSGFLFLCLLRHMHFFLKFPRYNIIDKIKLYFYISKYRTLFPSNSDTAGDVTSCFSH